MRPFFSLLFHFHDLTSFLAMNVMAKCVHYQSVRQRRGIKKLQCVIMNDTNYSVELEDTETLR